MKLKKIIADKSNVEVCAVCKDASIREAAALMDSKKIGVVLVCEDDVKSKKYIGIVSDSDVIAALCKLGDLDKVPVSKIMTDKMIVATVEDDVDYVMNVMMRHKVSHLPVIENKQIICVISMGDIIKALYNEDEIKIRYYGDYIGGTYHSDVF